MMRDIESSVLVFDHVSKRYARDKNRRFVLGPISFSLECGEVLRIQGDSGSGKTTVLRIAGLLTVPDRGGVHVCGEKATTEKSRDRLRAACIGIVFQDANLFGHLTVLQNLLVADQRKGNSAECLELLSRFGSSINVDSFTAVRRLGAEVPHLKVSAKPGVVPHWK
ncbi:MAG: ATP-binding cassette domain-containing protein [Bifidobacterium longum]|nr:ATP-binding cassette domain-containing protein [Bifidobacterium longum]